MDLLKWFVAFHDINNNSKEAINIHKIRQIECMAEDTEKDS